MLFNSYEFLLAFLPVTAAVFFALGTHGWIRASIAWLVFASLVYYAWWNPIYLAERGFMGSFGTWFPEPCRRYSFESQSGQSAFDAYRQLLVLAHERKVTLHLLTSPAHAHLFESMRVVGLWDTFETWKRRLAAINEEVARQLGVEPFPLFDFAVFDPATTEESVPPASSTEMMRYYWETSHYTPALGEHVLDRAEASGASLTTRSS